MSKNQKWLTYVEILREECQRMVNHATILVFLGEQEKELSAAEFDEHVRILHSDYHAVDNSMDYLHMFQHEMNEEAKRDVDSVS